MSHTEDMIVSRFMAALVRRIVEKGLPLSSIFADVTELDDEAPVLSLIFSLHDEKYPILDGLGFPIYGAATKMEEAVDLVVEQVQQVWDERVECYAEAKAEESNASMRKQMGFGRETEGY